MKLTVKNCGSIGVIKDLSPAELPPEAWTDASNIRFIDGYAYQFLGHGLVYGTLAYAPQFLLQVDIVGVRYWIYATATKCFAVTNIAGVATHTDITHATPRAGVVNQWTGFVHGGIPILNVGDATRVPMYWDTNLANNFVDLTNWPANTYAKVLCSFKHMIIAMNVTQPGGTYTRMIKWSEPSVLGALPANYDESVTTSDAGEFDIPNGQDPIIFGLGLKDALIVYMERSTAAISYVGGIFILTPRIIFGMSGIMNKHCAVDLDTFHFVVTGSDIVMHDGFMAVSVLDKKDRRFFFQDIDVANRGMVFCVQNPFMNEVFVCYPSIGATSCNKALVYNYVDKTVSFRTLPNLNHAAYGPVDNSLGGNWNQDSDPWDSDLTAWNGPDFTPDTTRVLMASADIKLFMLDASASFDGVPPSAFMERRGLSLHSADRMKLVTSVWPKITGNVGETVTISVGSASTPYADPVYSSQTFTIGTDEKCDFFVSGRYIAIKFSSGTAAQWRLDSYEIPYEDAGGF